MREALEDAGIMERLPLTQWAAITGPQQGDGPWKGQAGRPHGLVASLQLSLKFQWKSLLVEKRGVEMEVNWDKEAASFDQQVHSDSVSWASSRG